MVRRRVAWVLRTCSPGCSPAHPPPCFLLGAQFYGQYGIERVSTSLAYSTYPCCPHEHWPLARYTVQLSRSHLYYSYLCILPGFLLTIASVCATPFDLAPFGILTRNAGA